METNTRTQTNASNQLTTEGLEGLPLRAVLDDLLHQVDLIELSKIQKVMERLDDENAYSRHGQKMYMHGLTIMAKAVREMLRKEVQ